MVLFVENRWLISKNNIKGRQTGSPRWKCTDGMFHQRKMLSPLDGVILTQEVLTGLQLLVGSFRLTISLGVKIRGKAYRNIKIIAKFLPEFRYELRTTVRNNVLGESV